MMMQELLARGLEMLFGGYRRQVNAIDARLARRPERPTRVAIVGAGLAGLTAAIELAERGYEVHLFEKNDYLGGKVGSWEVTLRDEDGEPLEDVLVSHGFHAFFKHYYNLNELLKKVGSHRFIKPIEDYMILDRRGERFSFRAVAKPPLLNIISLALHGVYSFRKIALGPAGPKFEAFLRYDREKTFQEYDEVSFQEFADDAELPDDMRLMFNTFSRAFFAPAHKMSMAELIKCFHFYYLSHDHGLIYDFLDDDYEISLLDPCRKYLLERGARIRLGEGVESLEQEQRGWLVNGERFDKVVLAGDVVGTAKIVEGSSSIAQRDPAWHEKVSALSPTNRYSVLRLWVDRDLDPKLPGFFITERDRLLDSVSIFQRLEASSRAWVEKNGGAILELHCYAVPDEIETEEEIREGLLEEFWRFFPQMREMVIHHEHQQVRHDFAAFHVGMWDRRPETQSGMPGLMLAGDWVKLPYPAMLMEAACMSGVLAANAVMKEDGVQQTPVFSVPLKGLLERLLPSR